MHIQKSIDFKGSTGKNYTFDLYPKSAQLPENGGIYILTYCHPRGHVAGLQVNTLHIGAADNLNSAVSGFREDTTMQEKSWNYTGIISIEQKGIRLEYLKDLTDNISVSP
jgi:hypothetical protein